MARRTALFIMSLLSSLIIFTASTVTSQAKTFTVNSDAAFADASPGDGICAAVGGNCTLHAAIEEANLDTDYYTTINFASRFQSFYGHDIDGCSLPALTKDYITIDASEWWDTTNDLPGVDITDSGTCTLLTIGSSGNAILGIRFGGTPDIGIHVTMGDYNRIGGFEAGQRNVFVVEDWGVLIGSSGPNYVTNNYFGTLDGMNIPGSSTYSGKRGIFVQSTASAAIISHNLIAGQSEAGVDLWGHGNTLSDNIIGLNKDKDNVLPNNVGVYVYGDLNMIGNNNVIAGNISHGVEIYHGDNNIILNNDIGDIGPGSVGNGGDGIHIHSSDNTEIGRADNGNTIAYSTGRGVFVNQSPGTKIRGNSIYGNGEDGVYFSNSSGKIGGNADGDRNEILKNHEEGVHLDKSTNVTVQGNYIGLKSGNFDLHGNQGHGMLVDGGSHDNIIGGKNKGEGNWIGFNDRDGIRISGNTTRSNSVVGNILGAPVSAVWKAPNGNHGISIYDGAYGNNIGELNGGNTIHSSGWSGVVIVNSSNNAVIANAIGTDGAGKNWGNTYYGIHVVGNASGNSITFNEIAYNGTHNGNDGGEAGVHVNGAWANPISRNSIHNNDGPGIELVNGGNNNLTAPIITSGSCHKPVTGTTGGPGWIVEIFSDADDEGRIFEGTAIADGSGNWSWSGLPNGPNLTATARAPSNDTSPFSAAFNIGPCKSPMLLFISAIIAAKKGIKAK